MASVVGERVERTDGEAKVTGEAVYGVDYIEVGTLHAKLLRSPLPAGRITRLDVDEARSLPGVRAVYTALDAPDNAAGWILREQYLFASDVVRYEGEPIAMVVAESVHTAREALRAIRLEIEPEPAVGDIESALAEGARLVHPDWESYRARRTGELSPPRKRRRRDDLRPRPGGVREGVCGRRRRRRGRVPHTPAVPGVPGAEKRVSEVRKRPLHRPHGEPVPVQRP